VLLSFLSSEFPFLFLAMPGKRRKTNEGAAAAPAFAAADSAAAAAAMPLVPAAAALLLPPPPVSTATAPSNPPRTPTRKRRATDALTPTASGRGRGGASVAATRSPAAAYLTSAPTVAAGADSADEDGESFDDGMTSRGDGDTDAGDAVTIAAGGSLKGAEPENAMTVSSKGQAATQKTEGGGKGKPTSAEERGRRGRCIRPAQAAGLRS
jgi:hypothetical protein